jgi:transmembrane sensor
MADPRTLLLKYLQGKCSPDEISLLSKWIDSEEGKRILEELIAQQWNLPEQSTPLASEKIYARIHQQISKKKPEQLVIPHPVFRMGRYAAALGFILLSVFFIYQAMNHKAEPLTREVPVLSKTTQKGQKRTLTLTDGTRIVLNAESALTFPERFSDTLRTVFLQGEAFFDVAEDKNRPFIVNTPTIHIQVLGTSFNLSAYQDDSLSNVALLQGKVHVQQNQADPNQPALALKPGEMATYHKHSQHLSTGDFDVKAISAWKDGILYFNNAGYQEITQVLERWYGVQFAYEGKKQPVWLYKGEFEDKSLEYVLESISYACKFSYQLKDNQVMIYNP